MEFKQAVACLAMAKKLKYKFINSPSYYKVVCMAERCPWKLTAGCVGSSFVVEVISVSDKHHHTAEAIYNYKPKIRSKYSGAWVGPTKKDMG